MTTTPKIWQDTFSPVDDAALTQNNSKTIGLSNGNILVVWTDTNDSTADGSGRDIVGQIYDPLGKAIGGNFQVNTFGTSRNEDLPDIAATDDGGFVMAYTFVNGGDSDILHERYDATGDFINRGYVVNDNGSATTYTDPQVAFRPDGSSVVIYETSNGATQTIAFKSITASGTVSSQQIIRTDGGGTNGDPRDPAVAVLTDGRVIVAFAEEDSNVYGIETRIINTNNTLAGSIPNVSTPGIDIDPDIAALANGGWVVVWERDGDIWGRIYNAAGTASGSEFELAANTDDQNEPQVIGLPDGGFFLVWDDDSDQTLEGKRFDSNGDPVGQSIDIMDLDTFRPDVGLTTDGRILVSAEDPNSNVFLSILDPRDKTFTVTDGTLTVAARNGSNIDGSSAQDIFYGMEGDDELSGKGGLDRLFGGKGSDDLNGGKGNDILKGGKGFDTLVGGDGNDTGEGGEGGDSFEGGAGKDTFAGAAGKDTAYGDGGDDELGGGKGRDVLIGGAGQDDLTGGGGKDVFVFFSKNDSQNGAGNRDVITDFAHNKDKIDVSVIDADTTAGGNQAFTYIGAAGFSDAGQLRAQVSNGNIILQFDRNGDGLSDFEIKLDGPVTVDTFDFIL